MKSDTPRWAEHSPGSFDASPTTAGVAGLIRSPRPDTGKLKPGRCSSSIAALASRSFNSPKPPHRHARSENVRSSFFQPQRAHRFDDANHQTALTYSAPSFTGGGFCPSSMQKNANHVPAVRLMGTSRTLPAKRRCSTMATWPNLGTMTTLPSTRTVSGPLSARKPCSCRRRLKQGKPTQRLGR